MTPAWSVPKRYLRLNLYDGRLSEQERRLLVAVDARFKVSFSARASVSGSVQSADIKLSGLRRDIISYLVTAYTTFSERQLKNKIEITAGFDNRHGMVFSGTVAEASPLFDTADYGVNLKAITSFSDMLNKTRGYAFKGTLPLMTVLAQIASDAGCSFVGCLPADMMITNYSVSDQNMIGHLRQIADMTNTDVYTCFNTVYAKEKNKPLSLPALKINSSNLIGTIRPTTSGCDLDIIMDSAVIPGQRVSLTNLTFPELNGSDYFVSVLEHAGDTKGNKWRTQLSLIKG